MGLHVTHDCWQGPYSAFSSWRGTIEMAAGISIDWQRISDENGQGVLQGAWKVPPSDILEVLIVHSDCDGKIDHIHTGPLADRLSDLLPKIVGYVPRIKTEQFIAGLRLASESGEPVYFC